jgi:hypothetical protein
VSRVGPSGALPGGLFTVRYRLRPSVDSKALTTADPIRPVQNHHKSLILMSDASDKGTNVLRHPEWAELFLTLMSTIPLDIAQVDAEYPSAGSWAGRTIL